jgi:hypothetical protein
MRNRTRLMLVTITAALVLAAMVGSASARRFEFSNTGIRAVWPAVSVSGGFGTEITCPVTLEGTLHSRTISKVIGQLIGYITRAIVGEVVCSGGSRMRALTETLSWHIQYSSFTGTLPNITAVNVSLINASFLLFISSLGASCLFRTSTAEPATLRFEREAGGVLTGALLGGSINSINGFPCNFGRITLSGRATVTLLGSTTTRIVVRLVQ